jgi:serine/threonine protein kinase
VLKCPYKSKPEENKEKEHLHYSNTVDSWAVGVLVYELLVGCPPFYDKSKSNTEARIVSGVPHFPPTVSEAAKNFICAGGSMDYRAQDCSAARFMSTVATNGKHQRTHLFVALLMMYTTFTVTALLMMHHNHTFCSVSACCVSLADAPTALRKNPEERPTVLDMVHHPWVELYRMRRSMRQINLVAGAPTAATSTFTSSQVAAAAAAAGAAIGAANVSASCPSLANLSQLLQTSPQAVEQVSPSKDEQQVPLSAAAAAAAALNAVKKNIKQSVANKMIAGAHALQGKPSELSKLGTKEDLHTQLSSASSPCLLNAAKTRAPTNLLKAAMAGNLGAPAAIPVAVAALPPPAAAAPAALAPPGPLHKGGSLKLDADARTFLFAAAFGSPGAAPVAVKGNPPGALPASSTAAAPAGTPKQQAVAVLGTAVKLQAFANFRAAH